MAEALRTAFHADGSAGGLARGPAAAWAADAARPLRDYVGEYCNPYWGTADITERDGALQLTLAPRGDTFALSHWDGDTFTFTPTGENAPPGTISKATFAGNTV